MKGKWILLGLMACLGAIPALSQNLEVTGDYSYLHFTPTLGNLKTQSFNGGGFDASFLVRGRFGIKADLQFYANNSFSGTFPTTITRVGTIPAGTYRGNGSVQTYLFGPIVKLHMKHFEPFGEVLFGVAHSDVVSNFFNTIARTPGSTLPLTSAQTPFALAAGGGLDFPLTHIFAIRVGEVDYLLTRFQNPVTGNNNQNNFRVLGGIQIRLGAR
jgi:hypothetical protein